MLPYDLVPEEQVPLVAAAPPPAHHAPLTPAAAAAAAALAAAPESAPGVLATLSQESAASEGGGMGGAGGGRDAVLVMTKKECAAGDSQSFMVLKNIEAFYKHPGLGSVLAKLLAAPSSSSAAPAALDDNPSASAAAASKGALDAELGRQMVPLRLVSNQQLAARFELRLGCLLVRGVISVLRGPNGGGGGQGQDAPSLLHLAELLLDHDRPQRWRARERECLERVAQASLQDLEDLVFAWCVGFVSVWLSHPPPALPCVCCVLGLPACLSIIYRSLHAPPTPPPRSFDRLEVFGEQEKVIPLHARRYSATLNAWTAKARELWILLDALGKEMKRAKKGPAAGGKRASIAPPPPQPQQQQENDAAAPNAAAAGAAEEGDGAKAKAKQQQQQQQEAEAEEEARRQYRVKSQGIAMDAQAFLADVAGHCRAVGAAGGPVREGFWFGDTQALQEGFFAQPRAQAVKALTDSHSYLGCACCPAGGAGDGWLHPAMPDVCLVYGLYEAMQGRTLNIRTWFASFVDVICGGEEEEEEDEDEDETDGGGGGGKDKGKAKAKVKGGTKRKREEEEGGGGGPSIPPEQLKALWARFLHAVDELEHLGFTRPYGKRGPGDRAKLLFAYTLLGSGGGGSAAAAAGGGE